VPPSALEDLGRHGGVLLIDELSGRPWMVSSFFEMEVRHELARGTVRPSVHARHTVRGSDRESRHDPTNILVAVLNVSAPATGPFYEGVPRTAPPQRALDVSCLSLQHGDGALSPVERGLMFHVRMSPDERRMLEALAEEEGITASDWVRMTIRRSFAEHFNQRQSKKKAKP
jgi:hypothetical protein